MNRRWVSTLFWIVFFGIGLYLSRSVFDPSQNKTYPMADLFKMQRTDALTEQVAYAPGEKPKPKRSNKKEEKAAPSPSLASVQDLTWYLRDDRLCDFVKSKHDKASLIQAVVEVSRNTLLKDLFGSNGPMSGHPNFNDSDRVVTFYNALLYAGLLSGLTPPAVDYAYSEKLFRELETRDPDNGAYFYFHAFEAQKANRPVKEQHNLLMSAFRAQGFNTYIGQIVDLLQANLKMSPTMWLASIEVIASMPIPQYPTPAFIRDLIKEDPPDVHQQAVMFAMRMFDQPVKVIIIEKRIAQLVLQDSWERAYPGQKKPDLELKKKPVDPDAEARRETEWQRAMESMNADYCDRHWIDDYYSKFRDETYSEYE